jgi:hypothetical protein
MMGAKSRWLRGLLVGVAGVYACVMLIPVVAVASEEKPLGITRFSMEPTQATSVSEAAGPFGNEILVVNEPYSIPFTQAGGHPWGLTVVDEFTSEELAVKDGGTIKHIIVPTEDPKDIVTDLPPGLLGDPMAVPSCPLTVVLNEANCSPSTQVGVYRVRWFDGKELMAPIVNVTPERGQSAEFALENEAKVSAVLTGHLIRTAEGYGFSVTSSGIPTVALSRVEATFWGVPAESDHDAMRGLICNRITAESPFLCEYGTGGESSGVSPVPFVTMSTDCGAGPETGTVRVDSWEKPGEIVGNDKYEGFAEAHATLPAVTGCGLLQFDPEVKVEPSTALADEPVGLNVGLQIPLVETPGTDATPQLRNLTVTLPEGMSVSPGVVGGIQACEEFGPDGINITGPESEEAGIDGELQLAPGHCPDASIVGTAEAYTPFLRVPVKGHVYLAKPGCGGAGQAPCSEQDALDGNLYRLYLELGGTGELSYTGIHFKVALETKVNPATGQLTTTAIGNPQAPYNEVRVHLNEGPKAPIANPPTCGPATTTTNFTPWSAPGITPEGFSVAGTPDSTPSSFFEVVGCGSPPGLKPGFEAGTVTPQAGQFSTFTMNLTRRDREQYIKGIQIRTPPGLSGILANIPLCGEPQAEDGQCSASSKIGTSTVASGAGPDPFEIEGNVYLTGPYHGSPFGLSIVTNVIAGPFNLGQVVVRARIAVDPETATLTITTDETGPRAVPQIVFGVPVRLKRITVNIDRPNFMFNPTNCKALKIAATISGSENVTAEVSSPFAVAGCKSLVFKPVFTVSTSGRTSRASGASLDAKVSYPTGSMGSDTNMAGVKVSLPKQLPSRLSTLQKACPAKTFDSNPASCPKGAIVGIARSTTPLLPVELSGPVYFVSHGGEAFPSLIIVLQGYGVRVDLTASTFINKAGITSSTFKTVPDVPVKSFELYLPEGTDSALHANGNLCKTAANKLVMPTEFIAQNGAIIKQNTKIIVTGCKTSNKKKTKIKQAATKGIGR